MKLTEYSNEVLVKCNWYMYLNVVIIEIIHCGAPSPIEVALGLVSIADLNALKKTVSESRPMCQQSSNHSFDSVICALYRRNKYFYFLYNDNQQQISNHKSIWEKTNREVLMVYG